MMTEKEAKAKWCPMARVIAGQLVGSFMRPVGNLDAHNRVQVAGAVAEEATWHSAMNCIGSACMAWRWSKHCLHQGDANTSYSERSRKLWHMPAAESPESFPRLGFCGAFGEPMV